MVKQEACVNCNLQTRADQVQCLHYHPDYGHHPWATKVNKKIRQRVPVQMNLFAHIGRTYQRGEVVQ